MNAVELNKKMRIIVFQKKWEKKVNYDIISNICKSIMGIRRGIYGSYKRKKSSS